VGRVRRIRVPERLPFVEPNPREVACPAGTHEWVLFEERLICRHQECQLLGPSIGAYWHAVLRAELDKIPAASEAARFDALVRAMAWPGEMIDTCLELLEQSGWNLVKHGRVQDSEVITMFGIPHGISDALKNQLRLGLESLTTKARKD
jgi:hypothetical protein